MEHKVSTPRCFRSCKIMKPPAFNKILQANASNYMRLPDANEIRYINERPMMLSMWTQTYTEDFDFLKELDPTKDKANILMDEKTNLTSENERALLERIRILEKTLSAQTEILEQIHATSSRKSTIMVQEKEQQEQPQQHLHSYQYDEQLYKQEITNNKNFITPRQSPTSSQIDAAMTTSASVINSVGQVPPITESYKYTIIAEGNNNEPGQPIEIQIAADEDENCNMNTSADSGRLEICLADDQLAMQDNKSFRSITPDTIPLKRRRSEAAKNNTNNHNQNNNNEKEMKKSLNIIRDEKYMPLTHVPIKEQQQQPKQSVPEAQEILILNENLIQNTARLATPTTSASNQKIDLDSVMVSIGPNNTRIPARLYENMNWKSASIATRKLLMAVFDRHTLATHSMTGKPSPAFKNQKPMKQMLDPRIIQDIIFAVTRKCKCTDKQVRTAITTKCADENKMMKLQICKQERSTLRELNKENFTL